jgi:hypothetical protein
MKQITLILLTVFITVSGFSQRKIKKLDVFEKGSKVNIEFKPVVDAMEKKGLKIKIVPVSADELNSLFLKESDINGKFEYDYYENSRKSYFLKKRKKKREKSDFEFLMEGADWLLENKKINQQEYDELKKQLLSKYGKEKGNELYSAGRIVSSNPYYIQNKYLSVFKVEISNLTNTFLTFDNNIIIQSGNLVYRPLATTFIVEALNQEGLMNVDKLLTLERHHLPERISIPPASKFEKIIAVLPIDYNNKSLEISITGFDSTLKWEITKNENTINQSYTFYEIDIEAKYDTKISDLTNNFIILNSYQSSIFFTNNNLFISEKDLDDEFGIFTYTIYGNYLYYGRRTNLKGTDFIDIEKNKRKNFEIKMTYIPDLKKKVKE